PGVAEVPRVVARLLQRAKDERRKGLRPAPGLLRVLGDALARPRRELGRLGRRQLLGRRRRGGLELRELGDHELDGLRTGLLMDAIERLALPPPEQLGD